MNKILLNVDNIGFKAEMNRLTATIENVNEGLEMAERLGVELNASIADAILKAPADVITNQLAKGVKIEGMTLSPKKILELKEINITPVVAKFSPAVMLRINASTN